MHSFVVYSRSSVPFFSNYAVTNAISRPVGIKIWFSKVQNILNATFRRFYIWKRLVIYGIFTNKKIGSTIVLTFSSFWYEDCSFCSRACSDSLEDLISDMRTKLFANIGRINPCTFRVDAVTVKLVSDIIKLTENTCVID